MMVLPVFFVEKSWFPLAYTLLNTYRRSDHGTFDIEKCTFFECLPKGLAGRVRYLVLQFGNSVRESSAPMRHVSELSKYVDNYLDKPNPRARSDFLVYNVNDHYSKNGSIVDQMGLIENHASMVIKQNFRMQRVEYTLEEIFASDPDGTLIVITIVPGSKSVVKQPPPKPAPTLPPPTHPVYVTEKSIIIQ
ncbi:hypothetical protein Y032_0023g704 [Ancylostoma ceylanicum]|nr:hypothetical protein Y032_0023g704 [Ancylostoma ceylanicum]